MEMRLGVFSTNYHSAYAWMDTLSTSIQITAIASVPTLCSTALDLADTVGMIDRFQDFGLLHVAISSTSRRVQVVCGLVHHSSLLAKSRLFFIRRSEG
jgi:hypothetical protein